MKKNIKKTQKKKKATNPKTNTAHVCELPELPERELGRDVGLERAALIRRHEKKWTNGTELHYYFFTSPTSWRGTSKEKTTVRKAFKAWKDAGIGLTFKEVSNVDEAEIRIGFQRGAGSWSYIGRDVLNIGTDQRTMNFGWNIANDIDTAIHEIGHTLGFPHEHQNPNAGIEWNEEAVYADLGGPPNNWDRAKTFHNIIRKIDSQEVDGSNWDKDSIMHYPFKAGLINKPAIYKNQPLSPAPGLSKQDIKTVQEFYPALKKKAYITLKPFRSHSGQLAPGQQLNFSIEPNATRTYTLSTFGTSDTVMVLFEKINGEWKYFDGDDDSGFDRNARLSARLYAGREYALRVRLYFQNRSGGFAVMMW